MHIPFNLTPFEILLISLLLLVFLLSVYKRFRRREGRSLACNSSQNVPAKIKKMSEVYGEGIIIISLSGKILFSNKTSANLLGLNQDFDAEDLAAAALLKISEDKQINLYDFMTLYRDKVNKEKEFSVRTTLVQSGNEIPIKIFLASIDKPKPHCIIGISDLSAESEISAFRQKDLVTGLPNQNRAIQDIGMIISKMHSEGRSFALILMSLDNFTELRAMLGYHKTDGLIMRVSEDIQYIAKGIESVVYHMMRNNFLLMIPDINTAEKARSIIERIENSLEELFDYSNTRTHLTFSTGVSFFPKSGSTVDALIDSAYKALSEAKEQGGGYIVLDEEGLFFEEKNYEIELYNEMRNALKNREFELYYQPLIAIPNELVWGAEALIRWNHPQKGLVSPALFIPIAEKTGFIVELGRFVTEEAIKQQKKWEIFKFNKLQVSINLSLREIEEGGVVDFIAQTLTRNQVSPALIKFEITENIAMVNPELTKKEFERLKKIGVKLALDDFGTGHSSFGYLNDFSLDTLKIDQSFVTDMVHNSKHRKIVHAMIELGHNLDLQITAEGIEDKETYEMLKEFGCDIAQGYYFSRPLPVHEFQKLIRRKERKTDD